MADVLVAPRLRLAMRSLTDGLIDVWVFIEPGGAAGAIPPPSPCEALVTGAPHALQGSAAGYRFLVWAGPEGGRRSEDRPLLSGTHESPRGLAHRHRRGDRRRRSAPFHGLRPGGGRAVNVVALERLVRAVAAAVALDPIPNAQPDEPAEAEEMNLGLMLHDVSASEGSQSDGGHSLDDCFRIASWTANPALALTDDNPSGAA